MTALEGYGPLILIHEGARSRIYSSVAADGVEVVIKTGDAGRLKAEHELLCTLDLAGVVRVRELIDGHLVLDRAGNDNLANWLVGRRVGVDEFLRLALQLAEIIGRVHRQGVVHLDLNPWNVLVDTELGWLTVADFAQATRSPAEARTQLRDRADRNLAYIAPEQTGRLNRGVDHRADLYALGCTFYEMLTSAPPFVSDDGLGIVHAHLAQAPRAPHEVEPGLPVELSRLVLKLLAKNPEDRYQSAEALQADLLRARHQDPAAPQPVGPSEDFKLPTGLYGREVERAALIEALDRARSGRRGAIFTLSGPAGIGKTALATSLTSVVEAEGGHLVLAKFDQLRGGAPHAALGAALGGVVEAIVGGSEVALWKARVEDALKGRASALLQVLPQLEALIGPQPTPDLGPSETRVRFERGLAALLAVLARPEHPLVLVLDDVHWADPSSLGFLRLLARRPPANLLLVVTTRDEAPIPGQDIVLAPLDREHIAQFVADALGTGTNEARALADLILHKTGGNPFFVRSMLRHLHSADYVRLDPAAGWTWDLGRIAALGMLGGADELMEAAILRLDPSVRELLQTAACIGNQGSLALLRELVGQSPEELDAELEVAIGENLIGRVGAQGAGFRFTHDQVQRAAISTIEPAERAALHLLVGRTLLARTTAHGDDHIFEIVDQLSRGRDLISLPEDRERFAELNLLAARRARRSSAYGTARDYLLSAREALPRAQFDIELGLAEASHLSGETREGDRAVVRALALAKDEVDRAAACRVQAVARTLSGEYPDALDWGRQGLEQLGFDLRPALQEERHVQELLGEDPAAQILGTPRMEDRRGLATAQLLVDMATPSYFSDPSTFAALMTALVRLSLEQGNSQHAPYGYVFYGMMLVERGLRTEGHKVGLTAIRMAESEGDPAALARVLHTFALHVNHWREPARSSTTVFDRAIRVALEAGELQFACYAASGRALAQLGSGAALDEVLIAAETAAERARQVRDRAMLEVASAITQFVRCMQGRTDRPGSFDDDDFSEAEFLLTASSNPTVRVLYDVLRLKAAVLLGRWEEAEDFAESAQPRLRFVRGMLAQAEHRFYAGLAWVARGKVDLARECLEHLRAWEATCPENFRHRAELLNAEIARHEGDQLLALESYDRAADGARAEGFLDEEALANELAARFHLERGRRRVGQMYARSASRAMQRWGAGGPEPSDATVKVGTLHGGPPASALDLVSVLKAAEVISSEVVLERLLDKLMQVCMEAAGAERAVLMLEREGHPVVRAVGFFGQRATTAELPLQPGGPVAYDMVMEARRQAEPIVLDDAMGQGRFRKDSYVQEQGLRSVMVLPIRRQSTLVGVFWFENNLVIGAFTKERLRVLRLLTAQIASSLENSLLFEQLMGEIRERAVAERKLTRSEIRLQALFERAPDVFVLWDPMTRRVTQVNAAARELVGAHLVGQEFTQLFSAPSAAERLLAECDDKGQAQGVELELVRHAEPSVQVLVNASLVTDRTNRALYGQAVIRDVRPLKLAEEALLQANESLEERVHMRTRELEQSNEALETSNAELRQFAYLASHDLKSPIRVVSNYLQLLRRRYGEELDETGLGYIDKATDGAVRMQTLIDDVLAFSQAGRDRRPFSVVNVRKVIGTAMESLHTTLAETDGLVEVGTLPRVFGNPQRLTQLFQNLIENALKYRGEEPPEILISAEQKGALWEFSVRDNGIGIDPEQCRRIFVIFKRLHNRSEYSGTGIGLAICKKIVEMHGGTIWVESEGPGSGCDFRFTLMRIGPVDEAG